APRVSLRVSLPGLSPPPRGPQAVPLGRARAEPARAVVRPTGAGPASSTAPPGGRCRQYPAGHPGPLTRDLSSGTGERSPRLQRPREAPRVPRCELCAAQQRSVALRRNIITRCAVPSCPVLASRVLAAPPPTSPWRQLWLARRPPACPRDGFPHGYRRGCSPFQAFAPAHVPGHTAKSRSPSGFRAPQSKSTPAGWFPPNQRQRCAPWKGASTQGCNPNAGQHHPARRPLAITCPEHCPRPPGPARRGGAATTTHRSEQLGVTRLLSASLGVTRLLSVSLGWTRRHSAGLGATRTAAPARGSPTAGTASAPPHLPPPCASCLHRWKRVRFNDSILKFYFSRGKMTTVTFWQAVIPQV
ncbi:uncharacterized protein LOC111943852, partial [Cyanistes caeruleus]|uniref:uncharacterized protein LOC111943852 n=1 Tax=Cyanistes caeruleus TaxID=156563 RepID=UPI000CDACA84